jgi:hypothetical protein
MLKKLITFFVIALSLSSGLAFAAEQSSGESPLVGTWKLKSVVREVQTSGEKLTPLGDNPNGQLILTPDGHFALLVAKEVQAKESSTMDQKGVGRMHNRVFGAVGTFTSTADKINAHIDLSSFMKMNGKDVVRDYKIDGDVLTITKTGDKADGDDKVINVTVVFDKVVP